jgi:hypothetical protein
MNIFTFLRRKVYKLINWWIDRNGGYRRSCICGPETSWQAPCRNCGGIYRNYYGYDPNYYDDRDDDRDDDDGGGGSPGVREPRRPYPGPGDLYQEQDEEEEYFTPRF